MVNPTRKFIIGKSQVFYGFTEDKKSQKDFNLR